MVVSEQIFLAEILLMDMRFLLFVQCSNRSRGWGFALRPCLRNVRDMHWTGPRCPCKMIFLIQNLEFLILAKLVIQNLESYLLGVCAIGSTFLDSEPRWILEIFYKSNEGSGLEQVIDSYHGTTTIACWIGWMPDRCRYQHMQSCRCLHRTCVLIRVP